MTTTFPLVEHTDAANVTTLTLNRPERRNAFDDSLIDELSNTLSRITASVTTRAVVLRGAGSAFCAGADLDWMRRMATYTAAQNFSDARRLAEMFHLLDRLPMPTIALVQGATYGGGVGLVACCDIVIAAQSATFCLSETRIGLTPATISPYVVAAIGARQARRYVVTAEIIAAPRALALGLAHEIVADEQLDARCGEVLKSILAGKPLAQREAKDLVFAAQYTQIDDTLIEQTSRQIAARRATDEARDGIAAFLTRRPA